MKSNKIRLIKIFGILIIVIGICSLISWKFYSAMESWVYYGSEEYALEIVDNTIEAAYLSPLGASMQESLPSCGGLWFPDECWKLLQEESKASKGSYQVISTFNFTESALEKGFQVRDVSEIYVELSFDGVQKVFINVYEGCFNYCYLMEDSGG